MHTPLFVHQPSIVEVKQIFEYANSAFLTTCFLKLLLHAASTSTVFSSRYSCVKEITTAPMCLYLLIFSWAIFVSFP
uniref:Ovule protein n=1 Tax=Heterorhabditis bacteriophora TaxID=37862 RepID=A0A1I7W7Z8_HETBA